jgi:predicted DCC family thiol-disulfide oxidoreductase YuxK
MFYDGACCLCNRLVRFILQRSHSLQVAPLQSDTAKNLLKHDYARLMALNTMAVLENNTLYMKSNAVLRIIRNMRGLWPVLLVFKVVPVSVRDKLYEVLARNRRRWFGQMEHCGLENKTIE